MLLGLKEGSNMAGGFISGGIGGNIWEGNCIGEGNCPGMLGNCPGSIGKGKGGRGGTPLKCGKGGICGGHEGTGGNLGG